MLQIDKLSRTPIYEQVVAQIEACIRLGIYKGGDALPSVRALSSALGVNPNTLQKAYTELERRGMCVSVPGSGRFVAKDASELLTLRARAKLDTFGALCSELLNAGVQRQELIAAIDAAISKKEGQDHD